MEEETTRERWQSRGRAALFSAARPCLQVPRLGALGRCPLLPVSLLLPRPLLDWMGGGGGLVASSLLVVGRVCGTGQHVCDASIFSSNVFVLGPCLVPKYFAKSTR